MQSARTHVAVLATAQPLFPANSSMAVAINGLAGYALAVLWLVVRRRRFPAAKGLQGRQLAEG